jgi:hypothetical protein
MSHALNARMNKPVVINNTEFILCFHFCHFSGVGMKYKIMNGNKSKLSVIISNQVPTAKSKNVTP